MTEKRFRSADEITVDIKPLLENIHKNCENYNPKKDMCLKWFEENVSKKYKTCKEYSEFNDADLQKKWSN